MTTLVGGQTVRPFTVQTVRDAEPYDEACGRAVRAHSQKIHGRPRRAVEAEIARSLAIRET